MTMLMKKSLGKFHLMWLFYLLAIIALVLLSPRVSSADEMRADPPKAAGHERGIDWVKHTQHVLDELKVKLALTPEQMAGWDVWSKGVLADASQQLEKKNRGEESRAKQRPMSELTTPEQMERGIEHLRAEANWIQEHVKQLEAAQVRTKNFYAILNPNQKTIFDLFWREMFHRMSSHHEGHDMHEHEGHMEHMEHMEHMDYMGPMK